MSCVTGCKEDKYITYFPQIKCWLCDSHRHLKDILEQNLNTKDSLFTKELTFNKEKSIGKQILDTIGIDISKFNR